ncbi:MAG: hypothetical protein MZU91_11590 [Desulfosudis oleivorans]|nr:hypothetical protein [Desulfosudis oleivorans]
MDHRNRSKLGPAFLGSVLLTLFLYSGLSAGETAATGGPIIIDHRCTKLDSVPREWIEKAKKNLHIAYGHTSHGSQITTGMAGLAKAKDLSMPGTPEGPAGPSTCAPSMGTSEAWGWRTISGPI